MIDQVELRGFRTHKKLTIKFGVGVTTIVGESFDGKSNIIRGVRWVALNKPAGDKMINWDSSKVAVRVSVDGEKITRRKGKGLNTYKLTGVKKPYKAFGVNVPEKIAELLNVTELNFLNQFKPPFWFCETAGEVSKQLNSIVDLEIIDSTLTNISKEVNRHKSLVGVIEERVKSAREQKKETSHIPQMNKDLQALESQQEHLDEKQAQSTQLSVLLQKVRRYENIQKRCRALEQLGNSAIKAGKIYEITRVKRIILSNALKSVEFHSHRIKRKPDSIKPIQDLVETYKKVKSKKIALQNILWSIETEGSEICHYEKEKQKLEAKIKKLTKGKCPVCQKPMKA